MARKDNKYGTMMKEIAIYILNISVRDEKKDTVSISRPYSAGVTLVEILVTVGILALILPGIYMFQRNVFRTTAYVQGALTTVSEARRTLSTFSKELRSAMPSNAGAYVIKVAGTSTITFFSNIDDDDDIEQVSYFLSSTVPGALMKGVIDPVGNSYNSADEYDKVVTRNIRNDPGTDIFTYFGSTYAGTGSPLVQPVSIADIRLIGIQMNILPNGERSTSTRTYMTHVMVRNLKDNY